MGTIAFILLGLSSLFAVVDPLGGIPFFSGLTARMSSAQKRRTLLRALAVAAGVLLVFTFFGQHVLAMFGITVNAFRIAGGVIFFGIGLDMLQSRPRRWRTGIHSAYAEDHPQGAVDSEEDEDPSITPLGIPLLAGPGSITTVMILVPQGPTQTAPLLVAIAVLVILLLTGVILMGADAVLARLGHTGLKIIEKLMGLLVTVIAVQLLIDGITPVIREIIN
jgi:multiple antibiotic resistance protein